MSVKIIIFAFLYTLASSVNGEEYCPDGLEWTPCQCIDAYGKIFLTCTKANDSDLINALTTLKGYTLTELKLKKSSFNYIPSDLLYNITLYKLCAEDTKFFYLFDKPLGGKSASSLETMKMEYVDFDSGLDWTALEETTNLREVSVSGSYLNTVSEPLVSLGSRLETLELSNDELTDLHSSVFTGLPSLRNLLLKNNILTIFRREMLPMPVSSIEFLDLSNNRLSILPSNVFDGMPKINSLLLHGNRFTYLDRGYMTKIWNQLFFFNAGDNPIVCGCHLSWLISNNRPYHTFGQCLETETSSHRQLRELAERDFEQC